VLELCSLVASICCLIWYQSISTISRRLEEVDGIKRPKLVLVHHALFMLKQYHDYASERRWSRVPIVTSCVAFVCCVISCAEVALLLISHRLR
jgi:hypothetical protein